MSKVIQAAIYARVSSDQQANDHTVESQVAALLERAAKDGVEVPQELRFIDEAYSGYSLVRPALENMRDLIAFNVVDRIYVHSPDRLARKYAYQALLIEEFETAGVEVVFLNREIGNSPEDTLLLQVQGIVAEYEREKIIERNRRGKRHAAQRGSVSVLGRAPYGYRYISKQDGGGEAKYEVDSAEATIVRHMFNWVGVEGVSIGEVCRRLFIAGEKTQTGNK